ncbi:MAG TPA: 2,3-epoxybenzoyl-CoA dihydrolase [Blastocatellia bacterium]|nr:2,3-epoxybenzoyl-CoA dihydrolase [Blastocatellia bacterium]
MATAEASKDAAPEPVSFETSPERYRHITLEVDGPIATLKLNIQENEGLKPGYALKLNSYDMGVDVELADAVTRLRFEHPEVTCVVVTSALDGVFSSGANIFMLGTSTHAFKVNFCKFTNETRLAIEDATEHSGQTYVAALNGIASGGGYELPLACKEIYLVDDRRSAVALPEVPYLGVLPGTGGLTRVVDKRMVRRDRADVFTTLAEGIKGKRAVEWGLVDGVFPPSKFAEAIDARAREIAGAGHPERKGIHLGALAPEITDDAITYRHVTLRFGPTPRVARIELTVPSDLPEVPATPSDLGAEWFPLRAFRELDDAILRLRFNHPDVGLVILATRGSVEDVVRMDAPLAAPRGDWFVNEVIHFIKRTLKRVDVTAKSFFALVDKGSCFAGSLLELALAADRSYVLDDDAVAVAVTEMNGGLLPMGNGLTRLGTRFLANPEHACAVAGLREPLSAAEADEQGLATALVEDLDWDDEIRLAIEERVSLSPDSLTGLEANLRFAGPETLETKIFGRLSAWQNWIFQRPNAVGARGALTLYGRPESPEFDWRRT